MLEGRHRRLLADLEDEIRVTDPRFAAGLERWRPHRPKDDRLWPFRLTTAVAALLAMAAVAANWLPVLAISAAAGGVGLVLEARRARRRHGPPDRRARRRRRPRRWGRR